jgi:hypothetical protein
MNAAAKRQLVSLVDWAAIALCGLSLAAVCTASEPWGEIRTQPQDMVGTLSCSAATCHGGSGPRYWSGSLAGAEYVHWMGSAGTYGEGRRHYDPRAVLSATDGDPHALAGQRISSARFQEVLKRVSGGSDEAATYQHCARCHDPASIDRAEVIGQVLSTEELVPGGEQTSADLPVAKPDTLTLAPSQRERGISCETCHGGAKQWIAVHYQRDVDRQRLLELGMLDTKNLLVRARVCAGCHVGSAENDMNHDMIAAGHPPLRFELASYEALLPRKHWDDRPERRSDPSYEVQLWAVGRIASAEAALVLLEGRATRAARNATEGAAYSATPWPEFAESNCLACHQPLRSLAGGSSRASDRDVPAWQSWNTSLVDALRVQRPTTDELLPLAFAAALARTRMTMEKDWQPAAADVAQAAAAARQSLVAAAPFDSRGRLLDGRGRALDIRTALKAVNDSSTVNSASASWDDLCVRVSLLAAARRAITDASGDSLADEAQRLKTVSAKLRFVSPDRQWPPALADSGTMTAIGSELESIWQELLRLAPVD